MLTPTVDYKSDLSKIKSKFDIFICGSDQIWNPGCTEGHPDPVFFLQFARKDKITIAYAPSFAQESFEEDTLLIIKAFTENIDYLSVREKSGQRFLENLCKQKVANVLDPTLLLSCKDYDELLIPLRYSNYIFMYMLENYNPGLVDYAAKLSKKKGLKVIYISLEDISELEESINLYGVSPNEFLSLIRNAEYVVTNSFHATVFSVLFEKQFCTFRTGTSFSRMVDFLHMIKLDDRLNIKIERIDEEIDYKNAHKLLNEERMFSKHYLLNAISHNE